MPCLVTASGCGHTLKNTTELAGRHPRLRAGPPPEPSPDRGPMCGLPRSGRTERTLRRPSSALRHSDAQRRRAERPCAWLSRRLHMIPARPARTKPGVCLRFQIPPVALSKRWEVGRAARSAGLYTCATQRSRAWADQKPRPRNTASELPWRQHRLQASRSPNTWAGTAPADRVAPSRATCGASAAGEGTSSGGRLEHGHSSCRISRLERHMAGRSRDCPAVQVALQPQTAPAHHHAPPRRRGRGAADTTSNFVAALERGRLARRSPRSHSADFLLAGLDLAMPAGRKHAPIR